MSAIRRQTIYNRTSPGANTALFTAMTPLGQGLTAAGQTPVFVRVYVCLSGAARFRFWLTDGTTAHKQEANAGVDLVANAAYTFTFACPIGGPSGTTYSYTFDLSADVTVETLLVDEVLGLD